MKQILKSINTSYKGMRLRSRLEARTCVWLDHLGVEYEYEKEGYVLDSGNYLPDFLIHNFPSQDRSPLKFWLEVKATEPTNEEINKLRELSVKTGIPGKFLVGCSTKYRNRPYVMFKSFLEIYSIYYKNQWNNSYRSCHPDIHFFSFNQFPISTFLPLPKEGSNYKRLEIDQPKLNKIYDELNDCSIKYDLGEILSLKFLEASKAALAARFEFGEK